MKFIALDSQIDSIRQTYLTKTRHWYQIISYGSHQSFNRKTILRYLLLSFNFIKWRSLAENMVFVLFLFFKTCICEWSTSKSELLFISELGKAHISVCVCWLSNKIFLRWIRKMYTKLKTVWCCSVLELRAPFLFYSAAIVSLSTLFFFSSDKIRRLYIRFLFEIQLHMNDNYTLGHVS